MNLQAVIDAEKELLLPTYERQPVLFESGSGVHLFDSQGRAYLDFLSGIGVNALGYSHPAITDAIAEQSRRLIHCSNIFYNEYQAELARRLTQISGLDRAFFCNSGTEAMECALKLARLSGGTGNKSPRSKLLAIENSFHGRTFGSLSMTWTEKYRAPFAPLVPGVEFVRFNDIADLERKLDGSVAALCIEVIQGEGGINPLSPEFVQAARRRTQESGALLICDEIQSGLGRTGKWFAYQHHGILPDVITVAKPLAAGLPLGAVLVSEAVALQMKPGLHGTTFGGGPLACAVALKVLDVIESEDLLGHVTEIGRYLEGKLSSLRQKHSCIQEVRSIGLMAGVSVDSEETAKLALSMLLERGIVINRTHGTTLRFLPPFVIEREHVDEAIEVLDEALAEAEDLARERNAKTVGA